ncbi:MAG: YjjG family noncanonical pyrimidine nucleotidase [Clostridia bacterium]|nr:YjjG family noncanonical pyrimidine nucleotidase [Clostridia bacterium]
MSYNVLLFDADNTLLDFDYAEHEAFKNANLKFNLPFTEELYAKYHVINDGWWKKYEKGLYKKEEIVVLRFKEYLELTGIEINPEEFNKAFLSNLANGVKTIDGAYEVLKTLKEDYNKTIYIVTNGVTKVQEKRLGSQPFMKYIDGIFVSEEMGYPKPELGFFINAQKKAGHAFKSDTLIIGDSLTSDIKGGNVIGIDTCWFNRNFAPLKDGFNVTYTITDLKQIIDIVK